MTANLTPDWLFAHTITVYHWEAGSHGVLATPASGGSEVVTGHIQLYSHVTRTREGQELTSAGYLCLPKAVALGSLDEIEYGGKTYRLANISSPNFGVASPAFVQAELI